MFLRSACAQHLSKVVVYDRPWSLLLHSGHVEHDSRPCWVGTLIVVFSPVVRGLNSGLSLGQRSKIMIVLCCRCIQVMLGEHCSRPSVVTNIHAQKCVEKSVPYFLCLYLDLPQALFSARMSLGCFFSPNAINPPLDKKSARMVFQGFTVKLAQT